jgi:hypothetical protein
MGCPSQCIVGDRNVGDRKSQYRQKRSHPSVSGVRSGRRESDRDFVGSRVSSTIIIDHHRRDYISQCRREKQKKCISKPSTIYKKAKHPATARPPPHTILLWNFAHAREPSPPIISSKLHPASRPPNTSPTLFPRPRSSLSRPSQPRPRFITSLSLRLTCKFIYPSVLTKYPLYSSPHFNFAQTCFPVRSCKKGFGLIGW